MLITAICMHDHFISRGIEFWAFCLLFHGTGDERGEGVFNQMKTMDEEIL